MGSPPNVGRPTDAASVGAPSEESPEAALERGRVLGREEARSELEAARERERERLRQAVAALDAAAGRLDEAAASAREELVDGAVRFGLEVAEAVLGRELSQSPADNLKDALRRALAAAPPGSWPLPAGEGLSEAAASAGGADSAGPVVRLHPDDAVVVAETMERRGPDRPFGQGPAFYGLFSGLRVQPDPSVERGGCVLEIGPLHIDGQVSRALERVRAALADALCWGSCVPTPERSAGAAGPGRMGPGGIGSETDATGAVDASLVRAPRAAATPAASPSVGLDVEEAS